MQFSSTKKNSSSLKVALVYDWADTKYGGAEKILLLIHDFFPQAHLLTAYQQKEKAPWLEKFKVIKTSFLQNWPQWLKRHKAFLAPLLPFAFESFDLSAYNLIISVSSFAAKGVLTQPGQKHLCYLLTPTRFLYSHQHQYQNKLSAFFSAPLRKYLQTWDKIAAFRPDKIFTLSHLVDQRMKKYYQLSADQVIWPVLTPKKDKQKRLTKLAKKAPYFLFVGRLVAYKRADLAIRACQELGINLKIIGTGPEEKKLKKLVQKNKSQCSIEFLGNIEQKELESCYNKALALLAPGEEDFGLNLLEAHHLGCWVIANGKSGAMELLDKDNAFFIQDETLLAVKSSLRKFLLSQKGRSSPLPSSKVDQADFRKTLKEALTR